MILPLSSALCMVQEALSFTVQLLSGKIPSADSVVLYLWRTNAWPLFRKIFACVLRTSVLSTLYTNWFRLFTSPLPPTIAFEFYENKHVVLITFVSMSLWTGIWKISSVNIVCTVYAECMCTGHVRVTFLIHISLCSVCKSGSHLLAFTLSPSPGCNMNA